MTDTIAAIATALSPSAIGILRLSGPDTKAVLDAVFFPLNGRPMSRQTARTMVLGHLLDGEGRILDNHVHQRVVHRLYGAAQRAVQLWT